jgi:hypothetical protein
MRFNIPYNNKNVLKNVLNDNNRLLQQYRLNGIHIQQVFNTQLERFFSLLNEKEKEEFTKIVRKSKFVFFNTNVDKRLKLFEDIKNMVLIK